MILKWVVCAWLALISIVVVFGGLLWMFVKLSRLIGFWPVEVMLITLLFALVAKVLREVE